ncbi:uncharacterized protein LOC135084389 [Ostrinia nubilalis]|uniref:uncharacterized protein LOC135084389 n=1 Tax=Ostrinia nubilalis TaxID=29057 RepID=UPI0030824F0E
MVLTKLILSFLFAIAFADESPPNVQNLEAILPMLNGPLQFPPQAVETQLNFQPQSGNQQPSAQLEELFQSKPTSYRLYDATSSNRGPDRCTATSYFSDTLLPILRVLLQFLDHSPEPEKAFIVCELIKKYLNVAPPSPEKVIFLKELIIVEEHLLKHKEHEKPHFHPSDEHKTTIVFQKDLPGLHQENCRETFGRLIQTAVNVYKETAKYPQCVPSGYVDENLYHPNNYVKPQKPYQFVVVYEHPPTSYYKPEVSGLPIFSNLDINNPHLDHLYPSVVDGGPDSKVPNNDFALKYLLPNGQVTNNPLLPFPQQQIPKFDITFVKQYEKEHPEAPKNPLQNNLLLLLNRLTGKPSYDTIMSSLQPQNTMENNPSLLHNNVPDDATRHFTHIYPPGHYHVPGAVNDQLQNYPDLTVVNSNPNLQTNPPPNNAFDNPGQVYYVAPGQPLNAPFHLYGEHLPDTVKDLPNEPLPYKTQTINKPELTLEILLGLLAHPEGKSSTGLSPQLKELLKGQLWKYLNPNLNANPSNQFLELQTPYTNVNGPDGVPDQSLQDYLNHLQSDSAGAYSGNTKPDYEALLNNLQRWQTMSNANKLPPSQNKANIIELTYVLKRPKPLIYRPIYYVKYRLPYETFLHNFQNLVLRKPGLRSEPEHLYQELIAASNISDISPGLRGFEKDEILKLVFGNGTLIGARVITVPDSVLNEQLEITKNLNADVAPEVIKELNSNLNLNETVIKSNLKDGFAWPKAPSEPSSKNIDDTSTPPNLAAQFTHTIPRYLTPAESTTHSETEEGHPGDSVMASHPLNVKSLPKAWNSDVSN